MAIFGAKSERLASISSVCAFVRKKTGLDVGCYLTNTSLLTLSRIGSLVLSFVVVYAFTHFSTKEAYGKYTFVFSTLDLLSTLALPGMGTAITQSVARGFLGTLGYASVYRLRFSLLGSLALFGAALYYLLIARDADIFWGLLLGSVFFGVYYCVQAYQSFYGGNREFKKVAAYTLTAALAKTAIVAALIFLGAGVPLLVLASIVATGVILGFAFLMALKRSDGRVDKDVVAYGKSLTAIAVIGIVVGRVQDVLVGLLFGFADLAVFRVGELITGQMTELWGTLSSQIFPKLSVKTKRDAYASAVSRLKYLLGLWLIIGAALWVAVAWLVPLVFTADYGDSVFYARLFILASITGIIGAYFETYILSQKLTRCYAALRFVPVFNLVTLPVFIWLLGVAGLIYARILSGVVYSAVAWILITWDIRRTQVDTGS